MPAKTKDCPNCGDPYSGPEAVCPDCRPTDRIPAVQRSGGACPWCRQDLDWASICRMERRVGSAMEVIYYCGFCRAFLEVASWTKEKAPGD